MNFEVLTNAKEWNTPILFKKVKLRMENVLEKEFYGTIQVVYMKAIGLITKDTEKGMKNLQEETHMKVII